MARIGKTTGIPFHQDSEPTSVCRVDHLDPEAAAHLLVQQVMTYHRKSGTRSYVFVDPHSGNAYVLHEERPSALRWVRERAAWLVGLYGDIRAANRDTIGIAGRMRRCRTGRVPGLLVTVAAMAEDLTEHLRGYVPQNDRTPSPYWINNTAPLPGANTAAQAKPCANGSHSKSGLRRGRCKTFPRAIGEAVRHG